jgi:hypothetical protein
MRTHFPGALHEVRSAAYFPLGFEYRMDSARPQCAWKARMVAYFIAVLLG